MPWYLALIAVVVVERLAELRLSRRNLAWTVRQGGREYAAGHYRFMVVLHTGWLVGCVVEVLLADRPFLPGLGWPMLALVLGSQVLRWWCIATLGPRWNTRIAVVPGVPLVAVGPYRWLRHPNYVAVVVEGAALPLVHTAWITAFVFTGLDLVLLRIRIRAENAALMLAVSP
ncbi:MAG TPA: isoprenylcysteine carboxyl methyltransferase family protein [Mycobacteriales bacterium]|nr:isoprenylcysteine carboxyl methyltransferase family protein [Mycobacteriales bacterium]